jgi:hypothetical protein
MLPIAIPMMNSTIQAASTHRRCRTQNRAIDANMSTSSHLPPSAVPLAADRPGKGPSPSVAGGLDTTLDGCADQVLSGR